MALRPYPSKILSINPIPESWLRRRPVHCRLRGLCFNLRRVESSIVSHSTRQFSAK
ncbi:hypothetical protein TorRG33x02_324900, partial [Trema orientale]